MAEVKSGGHGVGGHGVGGGAAQEAGPPSSRCLAGQQGSGATAESGALSASGSWCSSLREKLSSSSGPWSSSVREKLSSSSVEQSFSSARRQQQSAAQRHHIKHSANQTMAANWGPNHARQRTVGPLKAPAVAPPPALTSLEETVLETADAACCCCSGRVLLLNHHTTKLNTTSCSTKQP